MPIIDLDPRVLDAKARAPADPEQAAELLRIAAEYFRGRKALPNHLADFLADAFESATAKPQKYRLRTLGYELHLTARNRRPVKSGWFDVGRAFESHLDGGKSKNWTTAQCAAEFGVSESTVKRLVREYESALKEERRFWDEERAAFTPEDIEAMSWEERRSWGLG